MLQELRAMIEEKETALAVAEEVTPETGVEVANSVLSPSQVLALRALTEGTSLNDAAKAAGVERMTLYRWRTREPQFMAAMNAWRREQVEHGRDQFLLLRDAAMDAVRQGLAKGDARVGIAVLDRMSGAKCGPVGEEMGPTMPGLIQGREIDENGIDGALRASDAIYGRLPDLCRRLMPTLIHYLGKIADSWGMDLLEALAEHAYCARELTPEQAKRVPYIILTAMDAEAALLQHHAASKEGAP